MRLRTRRALLTALLTAALLLTGCSSDSSDEAAPADDAAARAELEQAVRDYIAATTTRDTATAWDALSERCAGLWGQDGLDTRVAAVSALMPGAEAQDVRVDDLAGHLARVSYRVGDEEHTGRPWTREDGEWRYDGC
ncbi:hypothetical protein [Streptomyces sp. URMC 129]|uniref:hypothetical protein n=1 Tax=Streptomyces sp. URMC 129 TaxID=3423407 RepID=UPI003F1987CD